MKTLKYHVLCGGLCLLSCTNGMVHAQKASAAGEPKGETVANEQKPPEQKQNVPSETPGQEGRGDSAQKAGSSQRFDWQNRPKLNPDQERLLRLFKKLRTMSNGSVAYSRTHDEIDRLAAQLGVAAVRPALPDELLISHGNETEEAIIRNPSDENLVCTVAIKGDEEQIGTRRASIGREVLLPAKSSLIVRALYWTTPRMTKIK